MSEQADYRAALKKLRKEVDWHDDLTLMCDIIETEFNRSEAKLSKMEFAARQAFMAIEEGYDAPKIRDDLREVLAGGDDV